METLKSAGLLIGLLAAGSIGGWLASPYLSPELWNEVCKYSAGLFAVVWAGMMWLLPKMEDLTDVSGINYEEHRRLDPYVTRAIVRIKMLAVANALASIVVFSPVILSKEWVLSSWYYAMVGGAAAFALFGIIKFFSWREELRAFRSRLKERERLAAAREKALSDLTSKDNVPYQPDPRLDCYRNGNRLASH